MINQLYLYLENRDIYLYTENFIAYSFHFPISGFFFSIRQHFRFEAFCLTCDVFSLNMKNTLRQLCGAKIQWIANYDAKDIQKNLWTSSGHLIEGFLSPTCSLTFSISTLDPLYVFLKSQPRWTQLFMPRTIHHVETKLLFNVLMALERFFFVQPFG